MATVVLQKTTQLTPFSVEVLDKIIEYAYYLDDPAHKHWKGLRNVQNLLLVNSIFHSLAVKYLYRYCNFVRSNMFYRFLLTLFNDKRGRHVRCIDLQEFTSVGLGRSGAMMSQIQYLTAQTILQCLNLTPNLTQFLSCESIEDDISAEILEKLFSGLTDLHCLDFCGSSGPKFSGGFAQIGPVDANYGLRCLSFHECTDIASSSFTKILPNLHSLQRLDLTHTKVAARDLLKCLSQDCRLTHFSLSKCTSVGTTHDLIQLLVTHPAINSPNMVWLNLETVFSLAILDRPTISFLLQKLNTPNLRYLNLNGYGEVCQKHLDLITQRFPALQSLAISHLDSEADATTLHKLPDLKYVDLSYYMGTKSVLYSVLGNPPPSLMAAEISLHLSDLLPDVFLANQTLWRIHNPSGQSRRVIVHKIDSYSEAQLYDNFYDNKIYYDTLTGRKTEGLFRKPLFLRYASRKINCSELYMGEVDEDVFPNTRCERGLYRYYSLYK